MNIQVQQKAGEAPFKLKYGNYIGGKWVEPKSGRYMDNLSPVTGHKICEVPRSDASDIEFALDAAHKARDKWGKTSITERSNILLKIAQRIEENLDLIARAETWDNGKRCARPPMRIFRWPSTISVILRAASVRRKARSAKSTTTPSPIISMSRLVLSARSFRGTSRSSWPPGSLHPRLPPAIAWC